MRLLNKSGLKMEIKFYLKIWGRKFFGKMFFTLSILGQYWFLALFFFGIMRIIDKV